MVGRILKLSQKHCEIVYSFHLLVLESVIGVQIDMKNSGSVNDLHLCNPTHYTGTYPLYIFPFKLT
jgi:hypothetical protein